MFPFVIITLLSTVWGKKKIIKNKYKRPQNGPPPPPRFYLFIFSNVPRDNIELIIIVLLLLFCEIKFSRPAVCRRKNQY